ncbi:MAG: hypothetical protein ACI9ON_001569 [Limisphaerales bacterium]|jgi:hypothetical protein
MHKVNIRRILTGALATVLTAAPRLAYALAIPAVVFVALSFVQTQEEITAPIFMLTGLITLTMHTIVAVTTHRIIILGPDSVSTWGLTRWSMRETQFLLYLLSMGFGVVMLVSLGLILPQPVGIALAISIAIVVVSCVSLVFPSIAVEQPLTFKAAWDLAQGNIFPLVVCVWLFPIAISLPVGALSMVAYTGPLVAILQLVANALTIAALSLAYTEIKKTD